jgi:ribosomal protein S12 methylthiotransferase accessory factor YcaO
LYYFNRIKTTINRIKTTINRIKTTINRIKQTSKAVGVSKVFDGRSRDSARVPSTPRRRPATSKAAKRTNAPFPDRDLDPPLELYCW